MVVTDLTKEHPNKTLWRFFAANDAQCDVSTDL